MVMEVSSIHEVAVDAWEGLNGAYGGCKKTLYHHVYAVYFISRSVISNEQHAKL